ncbi:copper amine oxidase [Phascolomyces articulosus]|uniref:Amine oxidase n=1 Tax=Phascolomyces articulosus TaxID=60185 RepID=A0AAD5PHY4_9FUNG|nr:copper amine oxidase [Phascolomyces articulosus]
MSVATIPHPLDNLSADEIRRATAIVRKERGNDTYIFNSIALKEPSKDLMMPFLGWDTSVPKPTKIEREAFLVLQDRPSGLVHEIIVSLTQDKITSWIKKQGVQPTLHIGEMLEAEENLIKDPRVIEECRKLGITDMKQVFIDPWGVGYHESIKGRRLMQALVYMRTSPDDNQYAHPLDFNPIYDVNEKKVIDIIVAKRRNSKFERPTIPQENHHFLPEHLGEETLRKDLKPIQIIQPEGVSFTIRGQQLDWQKWNMHLSFNYREGLVINNVNYRDMDGTLRPLFYRVSLAEMVVPYANPYKPYNHKMAFDVGEYGLGNLTNSLELGCDCVGSIYYMDAVLADMKGEPWIIPKAICIHEEDTGLLFKHTDYRTGKAHSARSRRLVISHIVTAANYDYGLYYYFYQDGTFQYEVKATGELNTQVLAVDEDAAPYGTMVAPQIDAQHHQHLFSMRIDPMIDGRNNSVAETDVYASPHPVGHPQNMVGNAFSPYTKIFNNTDEAQTDASLEKHRTWKIINESKIHPYAKTPVGFKLHSANTPPLLAKPGSIAYERARFASRTLWVTPYNPDQLFPGGFYCYQSEPSDNLGLPQWTKEVKNVRNTDIVLWLTFGITHVPRVEDFPIMPVEMCGWSARAANFFIGNPGIDLPAGNKTTSRNAYAPADAKACCGKTNL